MIVHVYKICVAALHWNDNIHYWYIILMYNSCRGWKQKLVQLLICLLATGAQQENNLFWWPETDVILQLWQLKNHPFLRKRPTCPKKPITHDNCWIPSCIFCKLLFNLYPVFTQLKIWLLFSNWCCHFSRLEGCLASLDIRNLPH